MCSYLLVGFWYDRDGAAHAAQKAFVVNRVGDFGLLLGILGLFWATGSFDFNEIALGLSDAIASGSVPVWAALTLCFLVFMGPMAKSAQFPLHVWLPDAMEGPTPISALIHAATMVAAGVFLGFDSSYSDGSKERIGLQHCFSTWIHDACNGLWCSYCGDVPFGYSCVF